MSSILLHSPPQYSAKSVCIARTYLQHRRGPLRIERRDKAQLIASSIFSPLFGQQVERWRRVLPQSTGIEEGRNQHYLGGSSLAENACLRIDSLRVVSVTISATQEQKIADYRWAGMPNGWLHDL